MMVPTPAVGAAAQDTQEWGSVRDLFPADRYRYRVSGTYVEM